MTFLEDVFVELGGLFLGLLNGFLDRLSKRFGALFLDGRIGFGFGQIDVDGNRFVLGLGLLKSISSIVNVDGTVKLLASVGEDFVERGWH